MAPPKKNALNRFKDQPTKGFIITEGKDYFNVGKDYFRHWAPPILDVEEPGPVTTIDALLDCSFLVGRRRFPVPASSNEQRNELSPKPK